MTESPRESVRIERLLRAWVECNLAMVDAACEREMLAEVCRSLVETGGQSGAWALPDDAGNAGAPGDSSATDPARVDVSLRCDGERLGVLVIQRDTVQPASSEELRLLDRLGTHIGTGLAALRRRQRQLEAAARCEETFAQAAIGIAHVAPDGSWLRGNRQLCEFLGYPWEELCTLTFQDITWPEDLEADLAHVRRMLSGQLDRYTLEKRYIRKDGSVVWAMLTVALVRRQDGSPDYFISVIEDIRRRKDAEWAQRQSEAQLTLLIDHAPAALAMFDRDMRYLAASRRWKADYGLEGRDIVGHSHYEIFPEIPAAWREIHRRAQAGEVIRAEEDRFERADGSVQWLRWEVRPWLDAEGRIGGINIYTEDLGPGKTQELARRESEMAQSRAEAASLAKSAFLANMSHEIRTPLNAIAGLVHVLRRTGVREDQQEKLDRIESASEHLLCIINDILDLSKIEAGKFVLSEVAVDPRAILANVASMVSARAREKGLSVQVEPAPLQQRLVGDATRLQQALLNYAANAVKFTERGQVTLGVRLECEDAESATLRFAVEDSGIGIAAEAIPKLFAAFEQADSSTTRQYGGTGLGLAITRRLAELMGGSAGVASVPGRGSTFWFTARLRKSAGEPAEARPATGVEAGQQLRHEHAGRRVLLVEDEHINRSIAQYLLEDVGLQVALAENGREAVELAGVNAFDAILMDMQMPVMGGPEAASRIRRLPAHARTPIVAMTANAFAEDRAHCLAAGMDRFMTKPFTPDLLYATLLELLDRPR